jgi:hypothetical protein
VLVTEFLGVKRVPITDTIDGPIPGVFIPGILAVALEPAGLNGEHPSEFAV